MNILLLSAQKPDNTGSGVFLKELARSFAADGHRVCIVAGIAAEDEFSFPAGIDFHPVRFETDALPFPVVGMSDEMPYRATRYRELDAEMLHSMRRSMWRLTRCWLGSNSISSLATTCMC